MFSSKKGDSLFEYTPSPGAEEGRAERPDARETNGGPPPGFEKYRLGKKLESSSERTVYLARDALLDREALLCRHVLRPGEDPDALAPYLEEARALSRLRHDGVLALYDAQFAGDAFWTARESFDGLPLARALQGPAKSLKMRLSVMEQLLSALQSAHQAGIVVRELPSDSILVGRRGVVKISGLDDARVMIDPEYAVEPAAAKAFRRAKQADVFMIGNLLYRLLTGIHPFVEDPDSEDAPSRISPLSETCPALRAAPALDCFFETSLNGKPGRRFQDFAAMREALAAITAGAPEMMETAADARGLSMKYYPKGFVLFREGDVGDSAFILKAGRVGVSRRTKKGRSLTAVLSPVDIFGEMALFRNDKRRFATVTALDEVKAIEMSYREFQDALAVAPTFVRAIIGVLVRRLQRTMADAEDSD